MPCFPLCFQFLNLFLPKLPLVSSCSGSALYIECCRKDNVTSVQYAPRDFFPPVCSERTLITVLAENGHRTEPWVLLSSKNAAFRQSRSKPVIRFQCIHFLITEHASRVHFFFFRRLLQTSWDSHKALLPVGEAWLCSRNFPLIVAGWRLHR